MSSYSCTHTRHLPTALICTVYYEHDLVKGLAKEASPSLSAGTWQSVREATFTSHHRYTRSDWQYAAEWYQQKLGSQLATKRHILGKYLADITKPARGPVKLVRQPWDRGLLVFFSVNEIYAVCSKYKPSQSPMPKFWNTSFLDQ